MFSVFLFVVILNVALSISPSNGNCRKSPHLTEILDVTQYRSLILIKPANTFGDCQINQLYHLGRPIFNINLEEVTEFNGDYDDTYDIKITFQEDKIYALLLNHLSEFRAALEQVRKIYFWRARDKIIVSLGRSQRDEGFLKEAFLLCWKYSILYVLFVFDGGVSFTYNPFGGVYFAVANNSGGFQEKFGDVMGFRFRISMFPNVIDAIPEGGGGGYKGRDGLMSQTIMNFINATYVYVKPKDMVDYGENHNRTRLTGAFKDIATNVTDVAFNSRFLKDEFENLVEATYPHDRDDLTCLVPKVKENQVNDFARIFQWEVWFSWLIFYMAFTCVLTISYRKTGSIGDNFTKNLAISVGLPTRKSSFVRTRTLTVFYVVLSFFMCKTYQSHVISIFAIPPKPHQINTLEELAHSKINLYTLARFKRMLNRTLCNEISGKILPRLLPTQEKDQINKTYRHNQCGFIYKHHIAKYAIMQSENYINGKPYYHIVHEKPMPSMVCYIVKYGSPLLTLFNKLIRRLIEGGIHEKWKKDGEMRYILDKNLQLQQDEKNHPLSLTNMKSAFEILVTGISISTIVFILENILYRLLK